MITAWTQHIKDTKDKEQFQNEILGAKRVLRRLDEILTSMKKDQENHEISPRIYDAPNWEHRQAHLNGYKQCLAMVQKLINLDHKENNEHPI